MSDLDKASDWHPPSVMDPVFYEVPFTPSMMRQTPLRNQSDCDWIDAHNAKHRRKRWA